VVEIVKIEALKAQQVVQTTQKALEDTESTHREHRRRMMTKLAVRFMQSNLLGEFDAWRDLTIVSRLDLWMSQMDEERRLLEPQMKVATAEKERLMREVTAMREAAQGAHKIGADWRGYWRKRGRNLLFLSQSCGYCKTSIQPTKSYQRRSWER
jgi:hypothetical protein